MLSSGDQTAKSDTGRTYLSVCLPSKALAPCPRRVPQFSVPKIKRPNLTPARNTCTVLFPSQTLTSRQPDSTALRLEWQATGLDISRTYPYSSFFLHRRLHRANPIPPSIRSGNQTATLTPANPVYKNHASHRAFPKEGQQKTERTPRPLRSPQKRRHLKIIYFYESFVLNPNPNASGPVTPLRRSV